MEKYAPVLIPTLCRYEKLRVLVDSLSRNGEYAKGTELVIGLDFPPSDKYMDGHQAIKKYLPSISGFGKVTIIEQKENLGSVGNENTLIDYIYSVGYDSFIYMEDDLEVSPNFLEFINKGLDKYKDEPTVFSISGYNFPISMQGYDKNVYASYHFSAWGCGFWKEKRLNVTLNELLRFVFIPTHFFRLLFFEPSLLMGLLFMVIKHEVYGDASYEIYSFVNNWVSIFPTISKGRNWGHDGSGEHGSVNPDEDPCFNQPIDTEDFFDYDDIPLVDLKWKPLRKYFHTPLKWYIKKMLQKMKK